MEKKEGREKERDEGPKETRVPECLFEFLAKWPSVRSAGPGHPSQPASQPAGVKRNHTDLHIMIYIPVLCLFYSSFSHLVSCHRALRRYRCRRRPLVSRRPALFCLFFTSRLSILFFNPLLFRYRLEKCTDASALFPSSIHRYYSRLVRRLSRISFSRNRKSL